jgi:competence protein ComEA
MAQPWLPGRVIAITAASAGIGARAATPVAVSLSYAAGLAPVPAAQAPWPEWVTAIRMARRRSCSTEADGSRTFWAPCSLTASDSQVIRAPSIPNIHTEDPMRITIATVLALGVTVLVTPPASAATLQPQAPPAAAAAPSKPAININTATVEQLETLPGIGRKTAERIIEHRTKVGSFKRIEELMNVKGIGEKSFLKLKPLVVVPPPKTDKAPGD